MHNLHLYNMGRAEQRGYIPRAEALVPFWLKMCNEKSNRIQHISNAIIIDFFILSYLNVKRLMWRRKLFLVLTITCLSIKLPLLVYDPLWLRGLDFHKRQSGRLQWRQSCCCCFLLFYDQNRITVAVCFTLYSFY